MKRTRHFREIGVRLECGHVARINTSRYRVSADVRACIVGHYVRRGVWCLPCGAKCQIVEDVGVFRAT